MYNLRNLINRTSVPSDPQKDMNAAEDFLLLLLHAHIVAAAKVVRSSKSTATLTEVANLIVANFTRFPRMSDEPNAKCDDGVHL